MPMCSYLLDIPKQPTCMKLRTGEVGFIHVGCLGISNKYIAVPRQDSIRPHAVLSGHCNIIIHIPHS